MEVKQKCGKQIYIPDESSSYGFGFDPVTKDYKVVCKWMVREGWRSANCIPDNSEFWEALTLGQNEWRTISDAPPFKIGFNIISSVYVHGSIYWCSCKPNGYADFHCSI